jgi:iron-sulfur cluster repair protein YtfE (RIC family)
MDATRLLKAQHAEVKEAFEQYENAQAINQKLQLFQKIADALAAHATIEERIFYPAVYVGELKDQLQEAVEEHLAAKRVIADLLEMSPENEQFDAKMKVLKEEIEHHVEEEEGELFPKVEKAFPEQERVALGDEMQALFEELSQEEPRNEVPSETDQAAPLT